MAIHRISQGYVYVAWSKSFPRPVKIGCTALDPQKRINQFTKEHIPYPYELIHAIYSPQALFLEQHIHAALSEFHATKEFFRIKKKDAAQLVDRVASEFRPDTRYLYAKSR